MILMQQVRQADSTIELKDNFKLVEFDSVKPHI